jgi:hypothetical protein
MARAAGDLAAVRRRDEAAAEGVTRHLGREQEEEWRRAGHARTGAEILMRRRWERWAAVMVARGWNCSRVRASFESSAPTNETSES